MNNCWWLNVLMWIIKMIFYSLCTCLLFLLLMCIPQNEYYYEYTDLDNIKGVAEECSYEFNHGFSGGQGSPVCELEDGTIKSVKEYKYIYVRTYTPIKEILGGKR